MRLRNTMEQERQRRHNIERAAILEREIGMSRPELPRRGW